MDSNSVLNSQTTRTTGRDAIINNIDSIYALNEIIKSTLGPLGMDKMLIDSVGETIITNDGVQILKSMDIDHPAAKLVVEVAKTQDSNVGDGTTSCIILIAHMLEEAKELYTKGIHPNTILKQFTLACNYVLEELSNYSIDISNNLQDYLNKIVITTMRGKSSEENSPFLANLLVQAILENKDSFSKKKFKTLKISGPSITNSSIIQGVVFDKKKLDSSMPNEIKNPNVAIFTCPIEVQEIENSHQIQIQNYEEYEKFIQQEKQFLFSIANKILEQNINVVVCQKGVDDSVVSYLAQKGVLVLRRCRKSDVEHLCESENIISNSNLETKELFKYKNIKKVEIINFENEEVISFQTKSTNFLTMIVCASTKHIADEIDRAIEDSVGDIENTLKEKKIVAGGGSIYVAMYYLLLQKSQHKTGKEQLIFEHFANSLLSIPKTLAQNCGFDEIQILSELKYLHSTNNKFAGFDYTLGVRENVVKENIVEPIGISKQIFLSAKEAISLILRIDDVIAAKKIENNDISLE